MSSHDLARLLLTLPDLPVATHANNHSYCSYGDRDSHGPLRVGKLHHYRGEHLIIGNFYKLDINAPNWFVAEEYQVPGLKLLEPEPKLRERNDLDY